MRQNAQCIPQGPDGAEQGQFLSTHQGGNRGKRYDLGSERSGEHLRYVTQAWFQDNLGVVRPEFQASRVDGKSCRSPTRLTDANAKSRVVLNESALRLVGCNGSKGGLSRPLVRLVNPKVELCEDASPVNSPGAS